MKHYERLEKEGKLKEAYRDLKKILSQDQVRDLLKQDKPVPEYELLLMVKLGWRLQKVRDAVTVACGYA